MKNTTPAITQYHAEDFRSSLLAGAILLGFIALILLSNNLTSPWNDLNAIACLASAGLVGLAYYQFPQRPYALNLTLGVLYALLFLWEWLMIGFPANTPKGGAEVGKGILMDMLIWALPGLYIGIRAVLILPLLALWQRRWYE